MCPLAGLGHDTVALQYEKGFCFSAKVDNTLFQTARSRIFACKAPTGRSVIGPAFFSVIEVSTARLTTQASLTSESYI